MGLKISNCSRSTGEASKQALISIDIVAELGGEKGAKNTQASGQTTRLTNFVHGI
jgi:hypothetical protein